MLLPTEIPKCEIYLEYSDFTNEILISCSICKCFFHKSCYNQYEIISALSDDNCIYRCKRCVQAMQLDKSIYDTDFNCFICGNRIMYLTTIN